MPLFNPASGSSFVTGLRYSTGTGSTDTAATANQVAAALSGATTFVTFGSNLTLNAGLYFANSALLSGPAGGTLTIAPGNSGVLALTVTSITIPPSALTYAATQTLNFSSPGLQTVELTGDVTFASSNLAEGRSIAVRITAAASQAIAVPSGWVFIGADAPTSIAAGKTAVLSLTSFGTTDANVIAAYAVQT